MTKAEDHPRDVDVLDEHGTLHGWVSATARSGACMGLVVRLLDIWGAPRLVVRLSDEGCLPEFRVEDANGEVLISVHACHEMKLVVSSGRHSSGNVVRGAPLSCEVRCDLSRSGRTPDFGVRIHDGIVRLFVQDARFLAELNGSQISELLDPYLAYYDDGVVVRVVSDSQVQEEFGLGPETPCVYACVPGIDAMVERDDLFGRLGVVVHETHPQRKLVRHAVLVRVLGKDRQHDEKVYVSMQCIERANVLEQMALQIE